MSESGVVMAGTGGVWRIRTATGQTCDASLRGRLKQEGSAKLAVGDDVMVAMDPGTGAWSIEEILPRRSSLSRRSPGAGHQERVVAANIDQIIVVFAAAKPEPHPRMLDRFLVIAEANELLGRIVINKIELTGVDHARATFGDYERAGYPVHYTSVKQRLGLDALHDALHGTRSVLSGPSGVGKSSLLNALYPGLDLRVGEISESVNKGRHTTVGALLHPLPDGGYVVDTPGLREVGTWGVAPDQLDRCFPELRGVRDECRFADCTHRAEPGCAVRGGVDDGRIAAARYDSYLKLRAELEEVAERKW